MHGADELAAPGTRAVLGCNPLSTRSTRHAACTGHEHGRSGIIKAHNAKIMLLAGCLRLVVSACNFSSSAARRGRCLGRCRLRVMLCSGVQRWLPNLLDWSSLLGSVLLQMERSSQAKGAPREHLSRINLHRERFSPVNCVHMIG